MSELKCPACRCRTFAKVDEPTLDGGWDNSKLIRCVECKRTYAAPPRPDAPSAGEWMPIETAPKDGTIVVWHSHESDPYFLEAGARLTVYGAHMEALSGRSPDGVYMAQWGGEWDDAEDGYIPDWWFVHDSDWERPLAPTHWRPLDPPPALPAPPQADGGEG